MAKILNLNFQIFNSIIMVLPYVWEKYELIWFNLRKEKLFLDFQLYSKIAKILD